MTVNRAEKRRQRKSAGKSGPGSVARPFGKTEGGIPEGYLAELTQKAMQLHVAGRLQDAEAGYRRILDIDPDHADANHLLGGLALQAGNPGAALALISKAIAKASDQAIYHYNLGNVYQSLGRLDEAVASCRAALALKPDYAEARFGLSHSLQGLGRMEEAVAGYREALAAKPDNIATHNNLGVVLQAMGRMDEAVSCFEKAIALSPGYAEAHGNLGKAYQEMGRLEDAVARNRHALTLNPSLVECHGNLGNAFQELDRLEDAVASYNRAIALDQNYADAYSNLGNALRKMGRLEEAIEACQKAVALNSQDPKLHGNLGTALQKRGRLKEALASYRQAIALEPNCALAWENLKTMTKAIQYADGQYADGQYADGQTDRHLDGLGDAARASCEFAMYDYYLSSFKPHLADDSFGKAMAGLPSRLDDEVLVDDAERISDRPAALPEKLIALLHFGRSGTGLLHSLIDGHPEISTLPSVYLRGYFNVGVWRTLSAGGWRELPVRFADMYEVLFDAASAKITPGIPGENAAHLGVKEGMTTVGENRDEILTLDREKFCAEAIDLIRRLGKVDAMSFLQIVHAAYEKSRGGDGRKDMIFFHIHNPGNFSKLNFLRYAPHARLVTMIREPIQCCESWLRVSVENNDYEQAVTHIIKMLFAIDEVPNRVRESIGVRLEDLKSRPEDTLGALSAWMGVQDSPSLYEMTAQGKKWWGDPTSPDYGDNTSHSPFEGTSVKRPVGSVFSEKDQLIIGTLFYPFSVRFGYREADQAGFQKDLKTIRPLLDEMMDFEKAMADVSNSDHHIFKRSGHYNLLHASLHDRWAVLNEFSDYPHMLTPLELAPLDLTG